jgi:tetratricopeptide (TPR) repeat protein
MPRAHQRRRYWDRSICIDPGSVLRWFLKSSNVSADTRALKRVGAVVALLLLFVTSTMWSQQSSTAALTAYGNAVQLSDPGKRLAGMEEFLRANPTSSLAGDAVEIATWDSIRLADKTRCARWAAELLKRSPESSLAQAALAMNSEPQSAATIETFRNALANLDGIHKPEGFSDAEFAELRRKVWLLLDGAIGLGYVALQQYEDARGYLKLAVSVAPNDPRFIYSYAVALLSGKNRDTKNGYWQLARAVNLNAGSAAGASIAEYARSQYLEDGGTDADWKQFVAVTSIGTHNQARAMTAYSAPSTPAVTAKRAPESPPELPTNIAEAEEESQNQTATTLRRRKLAPATDPVSLGILLQTSLLKGENRQAIINTLRNLVRHLRDNDEAFLMAYSDQLDFQQDLTNQDRLLEDALVHLKPGSGAALVDGVSFAVGHLDRIGKNRNRVLLVISDGSNTKQSEETAPLSSQLHDVRIHCVGVDVSDNQDLLQRLAQYSGGRAVFVYDPQQFRTATLQLAQTIGLDFPR